MNGPGLAPPQNSRPGRSMVIATRVVVIVLTVCSVCILCWVPMLRLAIVRRRGLDWALFWGVLVLSVFLMSCFRESLAGTPWPNVAVASLLVLGGVTLTTYIRGDIRHQRELDAQLAPAFPAAPAPAGAYDAYAGDAQPYGQPGPPPAPGFRDAHPVHADRSFAETQPFRSPFPAQPSHPQPPRPRPPHAQPPLPQQAHLQQTRPRTSPFPPSHPQPPHPQPPYAQPPHARQAPPTPSYGYISQPSPGPTPQPQMPPAPTPPAPTPPPWQGVQAVQGVQGDPVAQAPAQPQAPGRHRRPQAATPYQPQRIDEVRAELDELSDLLRREPRDRREQGL
ncbi:hypothetical protein M1P56_02485 [Streptomyces sp. HU2014]|uniref:hypothetical protein n=1 Tax=Streptomyces sp. HU2014 TaxID=2939414 RepID=UPI00200E5EBA|nr:hypothetical protein [Streptomyces sp. HU2014]UQI43331.1 hypothetical protein M1P56_02485 [Streptomyces sp. HU2014]